MDPKKVSDLDPKLKEVYERVMGTKVPNSQPLSPPPPQSPKITPPPPQITQQVVAAKVTDQSKPGNVQIFTAKSGSANIMPEEKKGGSPFLAIVLVIAGLIFFVIYGFFWVRFFKVSLPFTLPF